MDDTTMQARAERYLETLCSVKPNRRTGSAGNRAATEFFASTVGKLGYEIDTTPFPALDHVKRGVELARDGESYEVFISPYSPGCDVETELVVARSIDELRGAACAGAVLLLAGEIASEPLMPKNFVFYNPDHHKALYALLEEKRPAAIVSATPPSPEAAGALNPCPMFVDGDFTIPSVYCTEEVADRLAAAAGERVWLRIDASRTETTANNVVVRRNTDAPRKIVFTAHIDAYEDSPGASDNAAGTVVLMLLAELLAAREAPIGLELVALNGEDHYSAGGQMDYLQRYGDELDRVTIVVNADDVGFRGARSAFSFYECSDDVRSAAEALFRGYPGLVAGDPWYMGDHMIFVQQGLPAIAFSTERMEELMSTVAHTAADVPQIVDCERLVELAHALDALVEELGEAPPQRAS